VDQIPDACVLPLEQASPARHPGPAPEFRREHLPGNAAAKDEDNARKTRAIGNSRSPTIRLSRGTRKERFDEIPQRIWEQCGGHTRPHYRAASGQFSYRERAGEVLLCALKGLVLVRNVTVTSAQTVMLVPA
jgi:hypothetical protein